MSKDVWAFLIEEVKRRRFDNKHPDIIYYADGEYFNKNFMKYVVNHVWGDSWVQSGYSDLKHLKQFKDFQERGMSDE
jgi:hypothetical protein